MCQSDQKYSLLTSGKESCRVELRGRNVIAIKGPRKQSLFNYICFDCANVFEVLFKVYDAIQKIVKTAPWTGQHTQDIWQNVYTMDCHVICLQLLLLHGPQSKAVIFAYENQQTITAKFADFQTKVCDKLVKNGVNRRLTVCWKSISSWRLHSFGPS